MVNEGRMAGGSRLELVGEASAWLSPDLALKFLFAANLLYLVCYVVRDVLWLRIFCVVAIVTIMPYFIWGIDGQVQWSCIGWNLLFFAINMFWIVVIFQQRRPPKMTATQRLLYDDVFSKSCSPQEMLKLLSVSTSKTIETNEKLIEKLAPPEGLILIEEGVANVLVDDNLVAQLRRGDFVGEMSYLTGEPAVADVVASNPIQVIAWKSSDLEKLFAGRPELNSALHQIIGIDLVGKLTSKETLVPELSVETVTIHSCLLYTSPSPRDQRGSRMPSSA